jgi:hypothetical protein
MSLGLPDKNEDDKNVDIKVDENRTATIAWVIITN